MLDSKDKNTYFALKLLIDEVNDSKNKICFWIGAGASAWSNYKLWDDIVETFRKYYTRNESKYDTKRASEIIDSYDYPSFFQYCFEVNKKSYNRLLVSEYKPKKTTPIYNRLISTLNKTSPLYIVTTNIDEQLEKNIPNIQTIQNSDIELCINNINKDESFICKLHGSVSSIESVVFKRSDYEALIGNDKYLALLQTILNTTTVIFIGYSLGDKYVFDLLKENNKLNSLFGESKHFIITPNQNITLPDNVHIIKYDASVYTDHRTPIRVIEEITINQKNRIDTDIYSTSFIEKRSAHLISDIYPPGTWTSSHTVELTNEKGVSPSMVIGHGITDKELPITQSTAMHDLVVALLCFDIIYMPLSALSRIHDLLGANVFWAMVKSSSFKFIEWRSLTGIIFPEKNSISNGDLCNFTLYKKDKTEYSLNEIIKKHLKVNPGKESEASDLFKLLEKNIEVIDTQKEPSVAHSVRGLLQFPSIRKLIGMSGATPINSIPRYLQFPVLRLGNVLKISFACDLLGIASTKLDFGSSALASIGFSVPNGKYNADQIASYVLSGSFDTIIGNRFIENPQLLLTLIKFRESSLGIQFRQEIFEQLINNRSKEFVASIDAGLKESINLKIMGKVKGHLAGLMMNENYKERESPIVWNDLEYSTKSLKLWKKRSYETLVKYCDTNNISLYDQCLCGSGEKLRYCCFESLKR
jgi:hypothetical protein